MATFANTKTLVVGSALIFLGTTFLYSRAQSSRSKKANKQSKVAALSSLSRQEKIKPPFPRAVRELLSKCRLAYLSTVDTDSASSHLSLMRFTYLHDPEDGEVVIMSTNTKTKKFDMLQKQKGVALLVHDFSQQQQSPDGCDATYSITLNGDCRIVTESSKEDRYRKAHLEHNPEYPQFIVGQDIAILCVDVTSARICNINDQVIKWDVADSRTNA